MSAGLREPIPWHFTDSPGVLMWTWITDHFVARIRGAEVAGQDDARRHVRSYSWDLSDLMRRHQDLPRLLVEGTAPSFEEAETLLREHVGKCYDRRLGYAGFSRELAFTFTLATGETVDVSPYVGTRCVVTVLNPDRTERSVSGEFSVEGYRWHVITPSHDFEIVPEHAVRITNRSEAAERAAAITRPSSYSGVGRIYREDPRPGCTGRPGFEVGTVDHAGAPRCPLHEEGLPDSLLR